MTLIELFKCVGLSLHGPVKWPEPVSERNQGVYVIALVGDPIADRCAHDVSYLSVDEQARWNDDEPVVYVGCTTRPLSKRISEFYRHNLGDRSPHSGGQAIKRLRCDLWVYWCPTESDPEAAESAMLNAFQRRAGGRLPFANRNRASGA